MKSLLFLLVCMLGSASLPASTLPLPDIGLPAQAELMRNSVITSKVVNTLGIRTSLTGAQSIRVITQQPGFTEYGLNFLHAYTHEFDFDYSGTVNGVHTWFKPVITFTLSGKEYRIDAQRLDVWQEPSGRWVYKLLTYSSEYRVSVNRRVVTYTAEQMAAIGKVSLDQLYEMDADYFYGYDRDPATHITSVFVTVSSDGSSYRAQTWVNLKPVESQRYGSLVSSYGMTGSSYVVRWKKYNGCTALTAISGGTEKGNFGLCELRGPLAQGSEVNEQHFAFDSSQEYAVVECQIEERQANGKNATFSGYWTYKGCDIDDPCGPARRLPRKPVS